MILLTLITKNLRILFRHFMIFFLIIFTPILVLLSTGVLYSYISYNISFEDVGVILLDNVSQNEIEEVLNTPEIQIFENLDDCTLELKRYRLIGCISFTKEQDFLYATLYINPVDDLAARTVIRNFENIVQQKNFLFSTNVIEYSLDEMNVQTQELYSTIKQLETLIEELEKKSIQLEQTKQFIINSLNSQQEIMLSLNRTGEDIEKKLDDFENNNLAQNIQDYSQSLEELQSNISLFKNILREFESTYLGLENSNSDSNSSLNQSNTEISKLVLLLIQEVENVENQLNIISQDLQSIEELRKNIESLLQSSYQEISVIQNNLDESISQTKQLLDVLTNEEENLKNLINILETRIQDLRVTYEKLQSSLDVGSQEILSPFTSTSIPIITGLSQFEIRLPFIFALLFLLVSPFLSSILTHYEFYGNSYQRIELSQTPLFLFYLAIFITAHIITIFKFIILFFIVNTFFNLDLFTSINFGVVLFYFVLINSVFILLGMFYGRVFSKSHISSLMLIFTCIFLILISQIVFPSFLFPESIQLFLSLNPIDILINMFKQELFFSQEQSINIFLIVYSLIVHAIFYWYFKQYAKIKN